MQKKYAEAIITQYPKDPEVLLDAGIAYYETGSKQTGIGYLETCAERDNQLGHCDFELGRIICPWALRFGPNIFYDGTGKNGMLYTAYTVNEEIKKYKRRKLTLYLGLALAILAIIGIFVWLRIKKNRKPKEVGEAAKKEKEFAVR